MNPTYLKTRIEDVQPEFIEIFERNIPLGDLHHAMPVLQIRKGDDYKNLIDNFCAHWTGTFTAVMRKHFKDQRRNGERIVFNNASVNGDTHLQPVQYAQPVNGFPAPVTPGKSIEEIRKEITAELMRELELERMREEVKELQRQSVVQNGLENRLVSVLERLMAGSKWGKEIAPIQGTQTTTTNKPTTKPMAQHNIDDLTEQQTEQLEIAVAEIFEYLGFETLLKVRDALKRDPSLANKLTLFI